VSLKFSLLLAALLVYSAAAQLPQGTSQSTTGDCSPIINGNGNTNICPHSAVSISPEQASAIRDYLKIRKMSGKVWVGYEYAAPQGKQVADALVWALRGAGITADDPTGSMMLSGCDPGKQYPGLAFDCVNDGNKDLAAAIAYALVDAKVVSAPVNAAGAFASQNSGTLGIIIRRP